MRAATVVQVLHGLFYVLLKLLVVAAIILSFIASFTVAVIPPLLQLQHPIFQASISNHLMSMTDNEFVLHNHSTSAVLSRPVYNKH